VPRLKPRPRRAGWNDKAGELPLLGKKEIAREMAKEAARFRESLMPELGSCSVVDALGRVEAAPC
jgi:hypothetical protein